MNTIPWIASLIFFASAALSVIYGRTLAKHRKGWITREEEPGNFWFVVGIYTFMGFFMAFVGHYFRALA